MRISRGNLILILALLFLIGSASSTQAQTKPFRIIGYVPNWIDVAGFTQNFDFSQVTHINYAFQNPNAAGNLVSPNTGLSALVEKAHTKNVKVLVSIGGGSAADGEVKNNFLNLISTSQKRADFIHKIVVYINLYKLDGLDVDEEGPAINSDYGAFIKQLADSLKPKGKLLTTAVGWGVEKIQNSTLPLFDFVMLMAYDYTGDWDQTHPGQHSPYSYAQKMIKDLIARGVKKENLCLGMPFYGYGFYKLPGSYSYKTILSRYPEAWQKDLVGDTIYYNGTHTIWKKTKLAMAETSGIMIWELSQDANGSKSLLKIINQTVDSITTTVAQIPDLNEQFIVYPNPAKTQLIIDNLVSENSVKIEILDMNGCIVKSLVSKFIEGKTRIRLGSVPPGNYICRITTSKGQYSKRFVKD
jgi:GH18 family chitinase